MTPATPRSETQADYVKVWVSGDAHGIAAALRILHDASDIEGFEIAEESRPYANRREPGFRVYVTLRFPADDPAPLRSSSVTDSTAGRPA
jgi:hypothetical protein